MSYSIISILHQVICMVFKIKASLLDKAWHSEKYLKLWWHIQFSEHGKSHKFNFTWARYFAEVCDLVRSGEICIGHADEILLRGNLIPGPEYDCPPSALDSHNRFVWTEDA